MSNIPLSTPAVQSNPVRLLLWPWHQCCTVLVFSHREQHRQKVEMCVSLLCDLPGCWSGSAIPEPLWIWNPPCAFLHMCMYTYTYTVNCSSLHYHISLQNVWARSQGSLPIQNHKLRMTQVVRDMNKEVVRNNHHGFSTEIWWLTSLITLKNENTKEREFLCTLIP